MHYELPYPYSKDEIMRNGFHYVGREVWLDVVFATETACATFRLIPIRTVKDERNEITLLERISKLERT